jgi:hypothetical protein
MAVSACNSPREERISTNGLEVVDFVALPFSLTEVKLLDGPFKHAMELDAKTLLNYEAKS